MPAAVPSPPPAFRRFRLELDGIAQGAFAALELPGFATEVVESPTGKRPGDTRRTHARLHDGVANAPALLAWFHKVLEGTPQKRAGAVLELGDDGEPVWRHEFSGAWPVRVSLGTLSDDHVFAVDQVELAVESWTARRLPRAP